MQTACYLYFPGCKIETLLREYDRSTRTVMAALDIELVDHEMNCCGYPVRDQSLAASILAGARNLALAAREGLALMTPCQCCYGQFKHVDYWLREKKDLRRYVNGILKREGLVWEAGAGVYHLLQVLAEKTVMEKLQTRIRQPWQGLRIAAHYGCHALRPGHVVNFDNPLAPTLFERLIAVTGATAVDWPLRLECCGQPQWGKNDPLSRKLMTRKIEDARLSGAQILATACTYCQMQFDAFRNGPDPALPAVLYTQILGRAMGLPGDKLGLQADHPRFLL